IVDLQLLFFPVDVNPHFLVWLSAVKGRDQVIPLLNRKLLGRFNPKRIIRPDSDEVEIDFPVNVEDTVSAPFRETVFSLAYIVAHASYDGSGILHLRIKPD